MVLRVMQSAHGQVEQTVPVLVTVGHPMSPNVMGCIVVLLVLVWAATLASGQLLLSCTVTVLRSHIVTVACSHKSTVIFIVIGLL